MQPLIKTENLSVIYDLGKSSEMTALDKVNIEIYPEEYIIFFGPSGSGKSTLLYSILGLETPTYGSVMVNGKSIQSFSQTTFMSYQRRFTGMVFQAYHLIPSLTVLDNVLLPQMLEGVKEKTRKEKAYFLLERFNIKQFANRYPQFLSGGQQQRVAIARAIINNPLLILADEPVGNLDSKSAEIVMDLLNEFNEKDKKTVVLVTHDPRYLSYAHRVYHMRDGKVTQEVSNPQKAFKIGLKTSRAPSQLEILSNIYPYFSKAKLQTKSLTIHLAPPLSFESQERFENILEQYITHKISLKDFYTLLDAPYDKGGAGLYRQSAGEFSRQVQKILEEADKLKDTFAQAQGKVPERTEIQTRVESLRQYLLDHYTGSLIPTQIKMLEEAITNRVLGNIDQKAFRMFIDRPQKKGGAGLNSRTAKNFSRMLEVIIAEAE